MRKVINIRHHHRFLNGLILEVQVMTVFISLKRIESVCTLRSSHILRVVINTVFHTARSHHVPLMLAQRTRIIRDGLICFVSDAYISTPLWMFRLRRSPSPARRRGNARLVLCTYYTIPPCGDKTVVFVYPDVTSRSIFTTSWRVRQNLWDSSTCLNALRNNLNTWGVEVTEYATHEACHQRRIINAVILVITNISPHAHGLVIDWNWPCVRAYNTAFGSLLPTPHLMQKLSCLESSHGRGTANVSELLTWGAQYITRNMTSKNSFARPDQHFYALVLQPVHLVKLSLPTGRSSREQLNHSETFEPKIATLPWDDSLYVLDL